MKRWSVLLLSAGVWAQTGARIAPREQPSGLTVRLTAPLTTKFNRPGDLVAARILEPPAWAGGYLEGAVREIHAGTAGKRSSIQFQFHTLHTGGKAQPVGVRVVSVANSKSQQGVDEDGVALEEEKGGGTFGVLPHLRVPGMSKPVARGAEKTLPAGPLTRLGSKGPHVSLAAGSVLGVELIASSGK